VDVEIPIAKPQRLLEHLSKQHFEIVTVLPPMFEIAPPPSYSEAALARHPSNVDISTFRLPLATVYRIAAPTSAVSSAKTAS
jgi:hypothetical protein